jgi:hypothetical protein
MMRKTAVLVLVTVISCLILANLLLSKEDFDLQTIKKAIKKNPRYSANKEVRWFKIIITSKHKKREKIQVTLPLTLVDLFFNCTKEKELKIDCDDYDLDLRKLYKELKKEGPMSLIEIKAEDATLKVWLE